jgi:hypothetical protein
LGRGDLNLGSHSTLWIKLPLVQDFDFSLNQPKFGEKKNSRGKLKRFPPSHVHFHFKIKQEQTSGFSYYFFSLLSIAKPQIGG